MEVRIALSCGLNFKDRVNSNIGWPLPSIKACLVDTETNEIININKELDKDNKE